MTQPMTHEQYDRTGAAAPSGRHPVNIGHLVMGMAFVGLVGVWALIQGDVVDGRDIRWLLPVPWVLAGIAGLLATTLTGRDRWATRQTGWVAPGADEQGDAEGDAETDVETDAAPQPEPAGTDVVDVNADAADPAEPQPDTTEEIR